MTSDSRETEDEKREAARAVIKEWNREQERKKCTGITVREAIRLHNEDIVVYGIIVGISELIKMIKGSSVICKNEGCNYRQAIKVYDFPRFGDAPKSQKCAQCDEDIPASYDYVNAIAIKLQDDEPDAELEQLSCLVFDKDTLCVRPGEIVRIQGHIDIQKHKGKILPLFYANSVCYERFNEPEITSKDIEAFKRFAKLPNPIDRVVSMFAPDVVNLKAPKLGILRSIVGAPERTKRGRIHTLLIGPPGVAKSMLARKAVNTVRNSRYVTAQNASGKGITAIIDKENDTRLVRLGAVPQARGAICAINEIGRMDYEDQGFLLDVMEEGRFTVDKYGIHVNIKSPTTIVATANPTGVKWNDAFKIDSSEIPVLLTLLDRFDQIYAVGEFGSEEESREYAERKASMEEKNIVYNYNYLGRYLEYATIDPTISRDAYHMLIEFWIQLKKKDLATNRTLDSLVRLAKAQARLHLSTVVDEEIVTEVMEDYGQRMLQYGEIVKSIESPRNVAYRELLSIIKETKGPIEFIEAARIVCKGNEQLAAYFGKKLIIRDNWKLKAVRDMLLNNPSIKPVNDKPLVLLWTGDANSQVERSSNDDRSVGDGSNSCDVCEVCDGNAYSANLPKVVETNPILTDREKYNNSTLDYPRKNHQGGQNEDFKAASHTSHSPALQEVKAERLEGDKVGTGKQKFSCPHCPFQTDTENIYQRHIVTKHPCKPGYPPSAKLDNQTG